VYSVPSLSIDEKPQIECRKQLAHSFRGAPATSNAMCATCPAHCTTFLSLQSAVWYDRRGVSYKTSIPLPLGHRQEDVG
jgi:hypothetical protein